MPLLDASLAFALAMLALASVSSLIVEIIHRVFRLRAKGLKDMLTRLYDREAAAVVEAAGSDANVNVEPARTCFVQTMLANPLVAASGRHWPLRQLEALTTEDFLRRLGRTDLGKQLSQLGEQKLGEAVDRVSRTFDELGAAASDFFTRRAKLLSTLAGIGLAVLANVDAVRIFDTFAKDPRAAEAVIAQSSEFQDGWKEAERRVAEALSQLQQEQAVEQVESAMEDVRTELQGLGSRGLPIGYDRYEAPSDLWGWLAVLLTGFLLGLGGPFWFEVVSRLAELRRALGGGGKEPTAGESRAVAAPPGSLATAQRVAMVKGMG